MRRLLLLLTVLALSWTAVAGEEIPLADLKDDAVAEGELGTWSLQCWGPRKDFPYLLDKLELTDAGDGKWTTPPGHVHVLGKGIDVRMAGTQNKAAADAPLPMVVFTAKADGVYALGGMLDGLWHDGGGGDVITWAVCTQSAKGKFRVVATGKAAKGGKVTFADLPDTQAVELKAGESLAVMMWKPGHWNAIGGVMRDLSVTKK